MKPKSTPQMNKLTLQDLATISNQVAFHASVVLAQRDPRNNVMDEKSTLLHKLWLRLCAKMNVRAGSFPTAEDNTSYEQIFLDKLKDFLDVYLETPINEQEFDRFINTFSAEVNKQIRVQGRW